MNGYIKKPKWCMYCHATTDWTFFVSLNKYCCARCGKTEENEEQS